MDNDEEGFINFKVTSDDLEFELDPRRCRKQTKDEAIYGRPHLSFLQFGIFGETWNIDDRLV